MSVEQVRRYTRAQPCPICGGWQSAPRGQGVRCHGHLTSSGAVALCSRTPGDRGEATSGLWIHRLAGHAAPTESDRPTIDRAPAEVLDRAYTALLAALGDRPADRHLDALRARGWRYEDWSHYLYRSWPGGGLLELRRLGRLVADAVGSVEQAQAVPGLRVRDGEPWIAAGKAALWLPVRDLEGRIHAVLRRPDHAEGGAKYLPLTSARGGGPKAAAIVHCPLGGIDPRACEDLVVTEGPLKADLADQLWDRPVVGLPGVGAWRRAVPLVEAVRPARAIVALDADASHNPDVAAAERGLVEALRGLVESVRVARWDGAQAKGLDDALAAGLPIRLEEPPPPPEGPPPAAQVDPPAPDPRPLLEITPNEHQVILDALAVVGRLPSVYCRAGKLVEVTPDHAIRTPSSGRVRELLTEAAEVGRRQLVETAPGVREPRWTACHPPTWLPHGIADRGDYARLVRPIEGVLDAPTLRPDGSLLDQPGYDPATRLYLAPGLTLSPLPADPSTEAADASQRLLDLVGDFPWQAPEHAGVWLAGLLALVGRPAIEGPLPLWLISSNTPGAGKDLLVEVLAAIALGGPAPVTPVPQEEEFGKLLTAVLISGQRLVLLGNAANGGEVGFPALDAALTSTDLQARVLGASELVRATHRTLWVATGNNVTPRHDLFRRCLPIRLESPLERPETRTDFRLAACPCCRGQVARHALTHRADYLRDALILLRHCHLAQQAQAEPAGTIGYPAFEAAVLHPLGRLLNLDLTATRTISGADSDAIRVARAVVAGWRELPGGTSVGLSARQVTTILDQSGERHADLRDALLEWSSDDRLPSPRVIGNRLKSFRGRVFGGWRLVETTKGKHGVAWRVEAHFGSQSHQSHPESPQSHRPNSSDGNGFGQIGDSGDENPSPLAYAHARGHHTHAHAPDMRARTRGGFGPSQSHRVTANPDLSTTPGDREITPGDSAVTLGDSGDSVPQSWSRRPTVDEDGWPLDEDGWPVPA